MTIQDIYSRTTRRFLGPVVHLLDDPEVTFRLIHEDGKTLYEHRLKRSELTPCA